MKNNKKTGSLIAILLLIAMISLVLLSGTYAKYTSSASGTDTATVASWKILLNDTDITKTNSVTFDLFNTIYDSNVSTNETDVRAGKIAPGTSGSFELEVENESDVTAQYSINFEVGEDSDLNIPIEYSTNKTDWHTNIADLNINSSLSVDAEAVTTTIYWRWAYEGTSSTNYQSNQTDTTDTQIGVSAQTAKTLQIKATMTASQVD